ncbi:MAG TPA: Gfo/Idh/MocA family oxidoreductase [Bryobacteraceae bacterium]|nr:Gfo/Idh/MocA family oxidoreductase [Bryobacteraceae bacterium]HPQ16335.1 Gfo/Idh/MocA family oxidoreductase [Bryobacteraceae bacterium]
MQNRKIRVALIGQGFMGRAHSNAFAQVKHFYDVPFDIERAVICARDRSRLEATAATWGWREIETDWRAVVSRKDIDLVDVAVPNALHAPISIAAAEAGKIVLCEKPLAVSAEEGARIVEAARGVPNMVWFNYRRAPAVVFARRLIDEGRIGRVFHYRASYLQQSGNDPTRPPSWKTQRALAGSGVIGDLLSHVVDTAMYLNGPIREVTALTETFAPGRDVDDAAIALVRFANGSVGSLEASRYGVGCRNRNTFEIQGERGMIRFNLENLNHLEFYDACEPRNVQGARSILVTGPDQPYAGVFWKPGHTIGYEHTFIIALGDFLSALAKGEEYHPSFADAQRVQTVLEAIEKSAQSGQWLPALH